MASPAFRVQCLFVAALLLLVRGQMSAAQTEREIARGTLFGIEAVGLAVDVEAEASIAGLEALDVTALQRRAEEQLREAGIGLLDSYDGLRQPYLYAHVNALETGPGLIPFSVQVEFRQPVYLDREGRIAASATTWEDSAVGLVTRDNLALIASALESSVSLFVAEFQAVNRE